MKAQHLPSLVVKCIINTVSVLCVRTDCDNVAGISTQYISDEFLSASSSLNDINNITSIRARPWEPSATGWIPASDDSRPWLEVRFTKAFDIKAIVTQGCSNEDFWVKSFSVDFSLGDTFVDGDTEKPKVCIRTKKGKKKVKKGLCTPTKVNQGLVEPFIEIK